MKKSLVVLLHIGFWGTCFILVMSMIALAMQGEPEVDARIEEALGIGFFFGILPAFLTFYGFYCKIFPKIQAKKYLAAAGLGFAIAYCAAVLGYLCLEYTTADKCIEEDDYWGTFFGVTLFMSFIAGVAGVLALVMKGFIHWFEEVKLREALKTQNQAMELALVKAQLDPHFLFNTINNIDVLILKDPTVASEYLNKLSDIMRFMLFETKSDEIPLNKELLYIEKYIELQKIRTANTHYVQYTVHGTANKQQIAPMIFIPFIENAFKHTDNKKLEKAISIVSVRPPTSTPAQKRPLPLHRTKKIRRCEEQKKRCIQ